MKAVVLLSGGLDSTVNFYLAVKEFGPQVLALTFDYGQRAARQEVLHAGRSTAALGAEHRVIELKWFEYFTRSALHGEQELPLGDDINIESLDQSKKTAKAVWVPNRNGIFLNIAAGFAEGLGANYVIPGFNAEEAATFPDNSQQYMAALNRCFSFSTWNSANSVQVKCDTVGMTKLDMYKKSKELHIPRNHLWPCYLDQDDWCGRCESCLRYLRAEAAAKC
jgi:7-cyano-7-deazaguanine synthase